jgi:hypothetical protein
MVAASSAFWRRPAALPCRVGPPPDRWTSILLRPGRRQAVRGRRSARHPPTGRLRMAVAKTMPRYSTGSDRQVQWAAAASPTIPAGRAGAADHRKPRIIAANDGQPIAQVSKRFRVFAQVVRSSGLSLARRKSPSRLLVSSLSDDSGSWHGGSSRGRQVSSAAALVPAALAAAGQGKAQHQDE